jgi:hypothetical protein
MMRKPFVQVAVLAALLCPAVALAQQTGHLSGKVTATDGSALPGVTIEARSNVLPTPRVTVTGSLGEYAVPSLPVGDYTVKFTLSGMQEVSRPAQILLSQDTVLNIQMGVKSVSETVTVTATATVIDQNTSSIKSTLTGEQFRSLPIGQEYRDLIRLIPGVMYSQDTVRGPSAGGSGQDNVYQFDGVNVTLPLFGTLSAEPASHDIAQFTTTKGGARAVDFDRSGGFTVDSVSRSGSNKFSGLASYQFQTDGMAAAITNGSASRYEKELSWFTGNIGGPVLKRKAYFYASYYRPWATRQNQANNYGPLPEYESTRNEGFGKVTLTPLQSLLVNLSYRDSHRLETGDIFGQSVAATSGTGGESWQRIGTVDASWVIDARSNVTFKYTHFALETSGRPDIASSAVPTTSVGTVLPISTLETLGRFSVPAPVAGNAAYNAFVQPLIDKYGYISSTTGLPTGGGTVGYGLEFNDQDFFRDGGQFGYNYRFGSTISHDVHGGLQWYTDAEDLLRRSNGWGLVTVPGGRTTCPTSCGASAGVPVYYQTTFSQQSVGVPPIRSEYRSLSFEVNDNIRWNRWSFNVGAIISRDRLYGQDLKEDSSQISGFVYQAGNIYQMYEIPFSKMFQPRVGATWAYDGKNTIYTSYARYNPAASSLPRAASWARNRTTTVDAFFDANGALFASSPVASSSGKLFVADMTPRTIDEYIVGTARELGPQWTGRAYGRFRWGSHFWEDTNNTARLPQAQGGFNPPETVHGVTVPQQRYIEDLTAKLAQIGSGSTYVIAELDGAYTRYNEVTLESEYRTGKMFIRGSYTWSHYYGNFDQDNSTTANDANVFVGSSFIGDGAGRQLWNFRDGDLRGDRPHSFKIYGYHQVPGVDKVKWLGSATAGAYLIAQAGQPWEQWSYEPYVALTSSTSDVSRYSEQAGSHRTGAHAQLDLNYTQNFRISGPFQAQLVMDLFNVTNTQTGYAIQNQLHTANYGTPRVFFDPRRFQMAFRLTF